MKIKLSETHTEQIELNSSPIIIFDDEQKKGYQTTRGFRPFGSIFASVYNELVETISESATPSYIFEYFQEINLIEIIEFMENGVLSESMQEKIKANTKTLPFRVGVYNGKPSLYYIGYEESLFIYDMLMIKQHNIKIKLCEGCGRAFNPNTKGLYCSHCRDITTRNKEKYKRLKKDPVRLAFTRLQQCIQKREQNSAYRVLFEKLAATNKKIEWLEKWKELDKRYQKVKRHCMTYDISLTQEVWNESLSNSKITSIEEFQQWISEKEQENLII